MTEKELNKLSKYDSRGVQTLYRTLMRNHYNLLKMVDNKSSIILTVNSIIISLLMGMMFIAPDTDKEIIEFGAKILIKSCFLSMIIAIIGMLPYKYIGKTYRNSTYKGVLYAGNFSKLSLEDYRAEMKRVMNSGENVYNEMINDLYFLGKAISIKQLLVVLSFLVFLSGIIFTILYSLYHGV